MSIPVVFVLDPFHADALAFLQASSSVKAVLPDDPQKQNWRSEATALMLRSDTRINAQDLSKAKNLKVIVKQGVGVDNIDLEAAKTHGVIVCNTPALNSEAVAELTLALALAVGRRVCEIDGLIRSGAKIIRSQILGRSLFQKTIGIIGMGNIGKVVAKKWIRAMEGSIIAYDPLVSPDVWADIPHRREQSLGGLLREADVVTLHVPLSAQTRNLIGAEQLAQMKKEAILINCARGGVVDEVALLNALKTEAIFGAALDATEVEPPTLETYGDGLLGCHNLVLTPHIGASTVENQSRSGIAVVRTLLAVLEGKEVAGRLV